MNLAKLKRSLESSGGVGLVGFEERNGSVTHVLFSSGLVVAVFRGNRHLARHEAEKVVEEMIRAMESEPERVFWIPVVPYRPPIHLMFGIPLPNNEPQRSPVELEDGMTGEGS